MKILLKFNSVEDDRLSEIINKKEFDKLTEEDLNKIVKKCSKCSIDKSLSNYSKSKKGFLGHNSTCKTCVKSYAQEHYLKTVEVSSKGIIQIL